MNLMNWFRGNGLLGTYKVNLETGEMKYRYAKFRIAPVFTWYDLWVGVYVDTKKRHIYVFPIPCIGFRIGIQ